MQRIQEAKQELALEQHVAAEHSYLAKEVQLRTLEMGIKDLQQYCRALEKALLKYHNHKMQSINQVRCMHANKHACMHVCFATTCGTVWAVREHASCAWCKHCEVGSQIVLGLLGAICCTPWLLKAGGYWLDAHPWPGPPRLPTALLLHPLLPDEAIYEIGCSAACVLEASRAKIVLEHCSMLL
jgi:hypothetical protein